MTTTNSNTIEQAHGNVVPVPELISNDSNLESNTDQGHGVVSEEITTDHTIFAEPVGHIGSFTITNSLLNTWLAVLILVVLGVFLKKSLKEVPSKLQNIFEMLLEGALDLADQVTGSRKLTLRIFPIAITVFLFILVNNWLGILPGVGSLGQIQIHDGHKVFVPLFRGGTADINTTLALSLMSVIGANIFGIVSIGAWKTFNKFVNIKILAQIPSKIKKDPTIIIVAPITFFVGLIEIIGEIAKVASLSFRLFGNVFAGEVLLASMSALVAYGVPIPFLFLEILVGAIQALIFAMLTLVYFTIASHDHDHEDEHVEEGEHLEEPVELIDEVLEAS